MVFNSRLRRDLLFAAMFGAGSTLAYSFWLNPAGRPGGAGFQEAFLLRPGQSLPAPDPEVFRGLDRLVVGTVSVGPGDHLWNLAQRYGTTWDSLRSTNKLDSTLLSVGQRITVHNHRGMIVPVRPGAARARSIPEIANNFRQSAVAVARANGLPGVTLLDWSPPPGDRLFVPDALIDFPDYIFPVGLGRISSSFGLRLHPVLRYRRLHAGLDMPRPYGTSVRASRDGRVVHAGWNGHYGRLVTIRHPDGVTTWYGHLSQILVRPGQFVRQKQALGNVGSSGLSTGSHLHFEVRDRRGRPLNPRKYLQ